MAFSLSTTAMDLIRSGLFGKDFDTYRSEIIGFINTRFGSEVASNIVASEQGVMLIEVVAFALATSSWYGDRQADETTLRDVRLRENAVVIARQLGYKPSASVPALVSLTVSITSPVPLPVNLTIEQGRSLIGPGGSNWETAQTTVFDAGGATTQVIPVRQGISISETFTSDGTANQVFELSTIPSGMSIAQATPEVFVDSVNWPEVAFLTYDQTNQVEIGYGFNPPRVIFGDGDAGNIPLAGAQIVVNYFATSGPSGAVASNTIQAFSEPLLAGTAAVTVTLSHNAPSTPGSNPETIQKIKTVAPQIFAAAKRAVTISDLDGWINSFVDPIFGAVSIGRATTPRSVAADAEALTIIAQVKSLGDQLVLLQPASAGAAESVVTRLQTYWNKVLSSNCKTNIVVAQILSSDSIGRYVPAPVGLAQALESFLDGIVESTVKTRVTDGSINLFSVNLTVNVKLLPAYTSQLSQTTIQDTIRNTLQTTLLGRKYGDSLRIGLLYELIEQVQGVDYAHVITTVVDNTSLDVTTSYVNNFGDVVVKDYEVLTMGKSPVILFI
jgi:hypothetical protein